MLDALHGVHLQLQLGEVLDESLHRAGRLQRVVDHHARQPGVHHLGVEANAERGDEEAEGAEELHPDREPARRDVLAHLGAHVVVHVDHLAGRRRSVPQNMEQADAEMDLRSCRKSAPSH